MAREPVLSKLYKTDQKLFKWSNKFGKPYTRLFRNDRHPIVLTNEMKESIDNNMEYKNTYGRKKNLQD